MNIESLKATLSKRGGAAVQNRFSLKITPPAGLQVDGRDLRDFELLCDNCSLPGRQITTFDYQLLQQSFKIPNGFLNEDVTLTFILTNDYFAKRFFDAWAALTVDFERYKVKYLEEYRGVIEIHQLTKSHQANPERGTDYDKKVYGVRLEDAFPTTVGTIALDNAAENTIQKFSVTISYKNFTVI